MLKYRSHQRTDGTYRRSGDGREEDLPYDPGSELLLLTTAAKESARRAVRR